MPSQQQTHASSVPRVLHLQPRRHRLHCCCCYRYQLRSAAAAGTCAPARAAPAASCQHMYEDVRSSMQDKRMCVVHCKRVIRHLQSSRPSNASSWLLLLQQQTLQQHKCPKFSYSWFTKLLLPLTALTLHTTTQTGHTHPPAAATRPQPAQPLPACQTPPLSHPSHPPAPQHHCCCAEQPHCCRH